jgi:glycosyltransferase involved in cell wall biosynthesis
MSADAARTTLVSIVIPLHDEEAALRATMQALNEALAGRAEAFELWLVDDGSTDGTWARIDALARDDPRIRGIGFSRRFGKEAALAAGLEAARGDAVVVMDGDLQHPPAMVPRMIDAWRSGGFDVVEAVKRRGDHYGGFARWRASLFYRLLGALSGYRLEGSSDFKLLDRRVVDAYNTLRERSLFFRGMTAWLGFRHASLPFDVAPREEGRSAWSPWRLARLAMDALTALSSVPLRSISFIGACFLVFAAVFAAQTLYRKLTGTALDGFTTVILLLLIVGSAIMISLGVIGEYVARIYDEVKQRPRYVVSRRVGR